MGRSQRWINVSGVLSVNVEIGDDGHVWDLDGDWELPMLDGLLDDLESGPSDLAIEFSSSGYYDPGVCSGPVERCYPPEGIDERTLDCVTLDGQMLPAPMQREIFEMYLEQIAKVQIATDWD